MRFRDKVALVFFAVILQTACIVTKPHKNFRNFPLNQFTKNMKPDSKFVCSKKQALEQSLTRFNDAPIAEYPYESSRLPFQPNTSPINPDNLYLNEGPKIKNLEDSKFLNELRKERRRKRKNNQLKMLYEAPKEPLRNSEPVYLTQIGAFPETQYPLTVSETWGPNYWNPLSFNKEDPYFRSDDNILKSYNNKDYPTYGKPIQKIFKPDVEVLKTGISTGTEKNSNIVDVKKNTEKHETVDSVTENLETKTLENNSDTVTAPVKEKTKNKSKVTRKIKIITKSRPRPKVSNDHNEETPKDNNSTSSLSSSKNSSMPSSIVSTGNVEHLDGKKVEEMSNLEDLPLNDSKACLSHTNSTTTDDSSNCINSDNNSEPRKLIQEQENVLERLVAEFNNSDFISESKNDANLENNSVNVNSVVSDISPALNYDPLIREDIIDSKEIVKLDKMVQLNCSDINHNTKLSNIATNIKPDENCIPEISREVEDLTKNEEFDKDIGSFGEEIQYTVNPDSVISNLERAITESKADGTIESLIPKIKQAILEAIIESAAFVPSYIPTKHETNTKNLTVPDDEYELITNDNENEKNIKTMKNQKYTAIDVPTLDKTNASVPNHEPNTSESELKNNNESADQKINIYDIILDSVPDKSFPTESISTEDLSGYKDNKEHLTKSETLDISKNVYSTEAIVGNIVNTETQPNQDIINDNFNNKTDDALKTDSFYKINTNTTNNQQTDNDTSIDQVTVLESDANLNISQDHKNLTLDDLSPKMIENTERDSIMPVPVVQDALNNEDNLSLNLQTGALETNDTQNVLNIDQITTNDNLRDILRNNSLKGVETHYIDHNLSTERVTSMDSHQESETENSTSSVNETLNDNNASILSQAQQEYDDIEILLNTYLDYNNNITDIPEDFVHITPDQYFNQNIRQDSFEETNDKTNEDLLTINTTEKDDSAENFDDKSFLEPLLVELNPFESFYDDPIHEESSKPGIPDEIDKPLETLSYDEDPVFPQIELNSNNSQQNSENFDNIQFTQSLQNDPSNILMDEELKLNNTSNSYPTETVNYIPTFSDKWIDNIEKMIIEQQRQQDLTRNPNNFPYYLPLKDEIILGSPVMSPKDDNIQETSVLNDNDEQDFVNSDTVQESITPITPDYEVTTLNNNYQESSSKETTIFKDASSFEENNFKFISPISLNTELTDPIEAEFNTQDNIETSIEPVEEIEHNNNDLNIYYPGVSNDENQKQIGNNDYPDDFTDDEVHFIITAPENIIEQKSEENRNDDTLIIPSDVKLFEHDDSLGKSSFEEEKSIEEDQVKSTLDTILYADVFVDDDKSLE